MFRWLAEQPHCNRTEERQQSSPAKHVHVRQKSGLLQETAIDQAESAGTRGYGAEVMTKIRRDLARALLKNGA